MVTGTGQWSVEYIVCHESDGEDVRVLAFFIRKFVRMVEWADLQDQDMQGHSRESQQVRLHGYWILGIVWLGKLGNFSDILTRPAACVELNGRTRPHNSNWTSPDGCVNHCSDGVIQIVDVDCQEPPRPDCVAFQEPERCCPNYHCPSSGQGTSKA